MSISSEVATPPRAGTPSIELSPSCHIPWRPGMRVGSGINSITGAIAPSPFEPFASDVEGPKGLKTVIHLSYDLDEALDATASMRESALLSLQPPSLRAWTMAKALSIAHPLQHTLSFVVWWAEVTDSEFGSQKPQLSQLAMAYAGAQERFRARYGDYFVAGYAVGKQFTAVVTLAYDDGEPCRKVTEDLKTRGDEPSARLPRSLDVKAIDASLGAHGNPDRGSIRIFLRSAAGEVEEIKQIDLPHSIPRKVFAACYDLLKEFSAESARDMVSAKLQHYASYLQEPSREPAIPLDRTAVDEMRILQLTLERCAVSAAAVPDRLINESTIMRLLDDQHFAVAECLAERAVLPFQAAKRADWIDRLTRIVDRFTKFYAVLNVWKKLCEIRKSQSADDWWDDHYASEHLRWSFGMTQSPTSHLVFQTMSWEEQLSTWRRGQYVTRDVPPGSRVVGWDVEFLTPTGHWYSHGCLLFRQEATFRIRAPYTTRPLAQDSGKWKFTLYHVTDDFLDILVRVYGREQD